MKSRGILALAVALVVWPVLPVQAAVWYVRSDAAGNNSGTDWDNAFTELQPALTAAGSGDAIWVARGSYRPDYDATLQAHTGNRAAVFQITKDIALLGGFAGDEPPSYDLAGRSFAANETILTGDLSGNDVPDLANAVGCFSGAAKPLSAGCETYDSDSDGNVDAADLRLTDNSHRLLYIPSNTATSAVIDGFTVRSGCFNAPGMAPRGVGLLTYTAGLTVANCKFLFNVADSEYVYGTALHQGSGQLTVQSCTFAGNVGTGNGICVYASAVMNNSGSAKFSACTFASNRNSGGGGAFSGVYQTDNQFVSCTFTDNHADTGGGILNLSTSLTLTDCTFIRNSAVIRGGAVYEEYTDSIATACRFFGNTAWNGGGVANYGGSPRYTNCLFVGNLARDRAGGFYTQAVEAYPVLANCTFSGNHALDRSGGIYTNNDGDSHVTVRNCILWGNTDVQNGGGRVAQMSGKNDTAYSCLEGGKADPVPPGILDVDPKFVQMPGPGADGAWATADDDYGDLHLQADSPCIDAGDNTVLDALGITVDLSRAPRFVEHGGVYDTGVGPAPVVDMGVFEHPGDCNGNTTPDEQDPDDDADGLINDCDNCPAIANSDQADLDGDGTGDACDDDIDGDGVPNDEDGCPFDPNLTNEDSDGDGTLDCKDLCPTDPDKIDPGICGCGVADVDSDADGVADCQDACPDTLAGAPVGPDGCPLVRADQDLDGDVDQTDFGMFQACLSGSATPAEPGCWRARLDNDDDVDGFDAEWFQACFSGPNIPAQPDCAP